MRKIYLICFFVLTVKLLDAQNYNWAFRLGGSGLNDVNNSVAVDATGNVYVAGAFEGTVDFDPNPNINFPLTSAGSRDIFFAKYSPLGALIWAYRMGSTGIDEAKFIRINTTSNSVYLTGLFQNTVDFNPATATANLTSAGGYDVFFAMYSSTGTLQFARRIGNTNNESVTAMSVNSTNGDFVISGTFSGIVDFDPNATTANLTAVTGSDVYVANYSSNFNYMGAFRNSNMSITDMQYNNAGDMIFLTGNFTGTVDFNFTASTNTLASVTNTLPDIYVGKYDQFLNFQWVRQFGGSSGARYGKKLAFGSSNIIVTGYHNGVIDIDPGPAANTYTTSGGWDYFVTTLSGSTGTFVSGFHIGGSSDEIASDIEIDNSANVYVAGVFTGTTDFDPGIGTTNLTSSGGDDMFYSKYTSSGNLIFAHKVGAAGNQGASEIAVTSPDDLYIGVNISGTGNDFDPSANSAIISSLGGNDGALVKYKACPDPLNPVSQASQNNPCALQSVTLTLTSGFIGGGANWVWYSGSCGGTSVGTGTSIVINPSVTANYYVRAEGGCLASPGMCSGPNNISTTPLPTFSVATSNSLLCAGSSASLTMSSTSFNYSVNTIGLPSNIAVVNPTVTTTYTITADNIGCLSTSLFTQSVTVCSSLNENALHTAIELYPNPSNGKITVSANASETIHIYNELGACIRTFTLNADNNFSAEITGLESGVYFLSGTNTRKKFVVLK